VAKQMLGISGIFLRNPTPTPPRTSLEMRLRISIKKKTTWRYR